MNEEEKQAIEKFENLLTKHFEDKKIDSLDYLDYFEGITILNLIENQQKEIEKLKSKKYMFNAKTQEIKEIPISDNYISKDKIKEKIKEIETLSMLDFVKKEKFDFKYSLDGIYCLQKGVIYILKELLGE